MLKVEVKVPNIKPLVLSEVLKKSCLLVESSAKEKAPVETGTLRRSIHTELHDKYGEVGTNLHYAPYVEYGTGIFAKDGNGRQTPWRYQSADGTWHTTSGMHPQPFLGPALEENRQKIIDIFRESIRKEL